MKKTANEHRIFLTCAVILGIFCFALPRLLLKLDDGNFLGMLAAPDFTYKSFLNYRYENLSGRTASEFLLMFFLSKPLILWKTFNFLLLLYIVGYLCKICKSFESSIPLEKRELFCCTSIFLIFVTVFNASVMWFAGSFTYLWPAAGMLMTTAPLAMYCLNGKYSFYRSFLACITAVLACSQEQAAASTLALLIILPIFCKLRKHPLKLHMFLPLIPSVLCSAHLFLSPGAKARGIMEAENHFPRFLEMSVFEKLSCGFTNVTAHLFTVSFFLFLIFFALVSCCIYKEYNESKKAKILIITANVFAISVVVVSNILGFVFDKSSPSIGLQKVFKTGDITAHSAVIIILFTLLFIVTLASLTAILIKNIRLGLTVMLLCAAAFGCGLALSFSGSIYTSGQRVFFYTDLFLIIACCVLVSHLPNNKTSKNILTAAEIYAIVFFIIDCISYSISELPLMA